MSYKKNSPPLTVVMKGKISYIDQNHFLHQDVNMFFFCCKVGHFNMGSLWDWLPFAASLQRPVDELQF